MAMVFLFTTINYHNKDNEFMLYVNPITRGKKRT